MAGARPPPRMSVADLMRCHYLRNTECYAHQGAVRLVALTCTHSGTWRAPMQQACGLTTRVLQTRCCADARCKHHIHEAHRKMPHLAAACSRLRLQSCAFSEAAPFFLPSMYLSSPLLNRFSGTAQPTHQPESVRLLSVHRTPALLASPPQLVAHRVAHANLMLTILIACPACDHAGCTGSARASSSARTSFSTSR
jgi:hypothetical protein